MKKRRTVITRETNEVFIVKRLPARAGHTWCEECAADVWMLTPGNHHHSWFGHAHDLPLDTCDMFLNPSPVLGERKFGLPEHGCSWKGLKDFCSSASIRSFDERLFLIEVSTNAQANIKTYSTAGS